MEAISIPGKPGAPEPRDRTGPIRLGFFGAFHPMTARAGVASTGMVLLLSRSERIGKLVVFGPKEARFPEGVELPRTELVRAWRSDDPVSLMGSLRAMTRRSKELDAFLFSIYPTFFGKSPSANGLGMLLPVLVRKLTGKPVVVFMHSFVESQDFRTLGYDASPISLRAARWLERRMGRSTRVAAGLESMAATVRTELGVPVDYVPMRFVESIPGLLARKSSPEAAAAFPPPAIGGPRVLLFGVWGPQKDLEGALAALRPLAEGPRPIQVTVAGAAHPNFPQYGDLLSRLARELPRSSFHFTGHVDEADVPALFRSHDILLLPYRATGGYSGVLNIGAAHGIRVVAYDHAQMRECAEILGLPVEFVTAGDADALRRAVAGPTQEGVERKPIPINLADARTGVEALIDLLDPPRPRPYGAV